MKIQHTAVFVLILIQVKCEDVKNTEKDNSKRFSEDLDDNEWHISHLKDPDFMERNECQEDTLGANIKRYKSALSNDGALVNFVSSDPIVNQTYSQSNVCPKGNVTIKQFQMNNLKNNNTNSEEKHNGTNTATTANVNANVKQEDKAENATGDINRRASEYLFSSVEYYDEKVDFDASVCPDAVDVIELEIDQLRNYDVECEMILEWRSLD